MGDWMPHLMRIAFLYVYLRYTRSVSGNSRLTFEFDGTYVNLTDYEDYH
jgi:hypothetical protein